MYDESLMQQIWMQFDPKGDLRKYWEWFDPDKTILTGFYKTLGIDIDSMQETLRKANSLVLDQVVAVQVFAPLGWAPTTLAPTDAYELARNVIEAGGQVSDAEQKLVDGWNRERRLHFSVVRVKSIGAGHDKLWPIAEARWSLVERALDHHLSGAYEASVPIVLAQVDGIVRDLCGNGVSFFEDSSKSAHHFEGETALLGLPQGLAPLRKLLSANVPSSGAHGTISRHGILHGRELGYDTLVNSTKAFVLLAAVLDWAQPRARRLVEQQQLDREEKFAGSRQLDESGRRMDRRGFGDAKKDLGVVDLLQSSYFQAHAKYSDDPAKLLRRSGSLFQFDLKETHIATSVDCKGYWAWRATPTGYCFGSAAHADTDGVWHYGGEDAPLSGPWGSDDWRHVRNDPAHLEW